MHVLATDRPGCDGKVAKEVSLGRDFRSLLRILIATKTSLLAGASPLVKRAELVS